MEVPDEDEDMNGGPDANVIFVLERANLETAKVGKARNAVLSPHLTPFASHVAAVLQPKNEEIIFYYFWFFVLLLLRTS